MCVKVRYRKTRNISFYMSIYFYCLIFIFKGKYIYKFTVFRVFLITETILSFSVLQRLTVFSVVFQRPLLACRKKSSSTFFLRLCRCCCPSCVLPRRSGKASGFRDRDRGALGYLNGSVSFESRPLRTEHSERDRKRPDEGMLLTPIMTVCLEGHRPKLCLMIRLCTWTSLISDFARTSNLRRFSRIVPEAQKKNPDDHR